MSSYTTQSMHIQATTRAGRYQDRRVLRLMELESRDLMATYLWTGAAGGGNENWSERLNWLVNGAVPMQAPGAADDINFDGTGVNDNGTVVIHDSNVDLGFGGTVRSLSVVAGYNKTITLNKDLLVMGTAAADMPPSANEVATGTITGSKSLTFDAPVGRTATLAWTGGTIATPTNVMSRVTLTMSGAADKLLQKRTFALFGTGSWNGQGKMVMSESAIFTVKSGATMSITGATIIDGSNSEKFQNYGTLSLSTTAPNEVSYKAFFLNGGSTSVQQGAIRTRSTYNSGDITIAPGATASFGDNSQVITFDSAQGLQRSELKGLGQVAFLPQSTVVLNGLAKVVSVTDESTSTSGSGNLEISGTYYWWPAGGGSWEGTGTTTVNAGATLYLRDQLTVSRNVKNSGTTNWHRTVYPNIAGPKITISTGATWDNLDGALFSVKMTPSALVPGNQYSDAQIDGAGTFNNKNASVLRNQSSINVLVSPKYNPSGGAKVDEKSPTSILPAPYTPVPFFPKAIRFLQSVNSTSGLFNTEQNSAIVFNAGLDQSGGSITSSGGVGVAGTYNLSGGTNTFSGTYDGKSLAADAVVQSGGTLTADNTSALSITNSYNQTNGIAEIKFSSATVGSGGWTVGQLATFYAFHGSFFGNLFNSGLIEVGYSSDPAHAGLDTFAINGNYTQTSVGRLTLDVGANTLDKLAITGLATLAGTMTARAASNFNSWVGMSLEFMTFGSKTGMFNTIFYPPGSWTSIYTSNAFRMQRTG